VGRATDAVDLADQTFEGAIEHPLVEYATRPTTDAVAVLSRDLQEGRRQLAFTAESGYLRALLSALAVPVDSQVMVFSRTGIQGDITGPANPRALFFNDAVVVGYIRNAPMLEIAAHDPRQGVVFYTLDQAWQAIPVFARRDRRCLACHDSRSTLGVPGMLARSTFPATDGTPMFRQDRFTVDHRTPFEQRWGGWYVTGEHGDMRHMGNATYGDLPYAASLTPMQAPTPRSLDGRVPSGGYPLLSSDIVSLMVFEHQMHMVNLLTRLNWQARLSVIDGRLEVDATQMQTAIREAVDYLLFVDEAPLPSPIAGASGYAATFSSEGPYDGQGRSLRQLDLRTHLMRYRCSYMIYSAAFDALPDDLRSAVYLRMWRVLSGNDPDPRYTTLPRAERLAIVEILAATRKGWPDAVRASADPFR
jgi:hypothetical protein